MLVASDDAYLVNTSSVNGFWACLGPGIPHTAYSTAKFAVKGFSEALLTDFRINAPHVKVAVVMPGHIGTDIVENSRRIHGGSDPEHMTTEELAAMRADLQRQGLPVADVTDDQLRMGMKMMADGFRNNAPLTAAQAATIILDGVRRDDWRILVGDDALALGSGRARGSARGLRRFDLAQHPDGLTLAAKDAALTACATASTGCPGAPGAHRRPKRRCAR